MPMKEFIRKNKDVFLFILMAALLLIVFLKKDRLFLRPYYDFRSVNSAFYGDSGRIYVIDKGREAITVLDNRGTVSDILNGGEERAFYYACEVTEGEGNTLFILDEAYVSPEEGTEDREETEKEYRILEYKNRKYSPLFLSGAGKIYDMQYSGGALHFLRAESYGLGQYRLVPGYEAELVKRIYSGDFLNDASLDLSTDAVAIATKRGAVRLQKKNAAGWDTLKKDVPHLMPSCITARNGSVFFSELYGGGICSFSEAYLGSYKVLYSAEGLKINSIHGNTNGDRILASDLKSFYRLNTGQNGSAEVFYQGAAGNSIFYRTVILWLLLLLSAAIFLYFMRFVPGILSNLIHNESALRMAVVVVAVVLVSGFIALSLLSDERKKTDDRDIEEMKLFSNMMLNELDSETLSKINWEYDYMGSAYMRFRDETDIYIRQSEERGRNYRYCFYDVDKEGSRYLLNFDDNVMCGEPCGMKDDTYIRDCFENGTSYALKEKDSEGTWISILSRVNDAGGNPLSVMEISTDLKYREEERAVQTRDTVLNVFCSSAVMMMLIIEALFLISFYEEKSASVKKGVIPDSTKAVPLRTVITLAYLSYAMQDPFITILASRLYNKDFIIPEVLADGLPLTVQLLMMAVSSAFVGQISEKVYSKRLLFTGLFIDKGILHRVGKVRESDHGP